MTGTTERGRAAQWLASKQLPGGGESALAFRHRFTPTNVAPDVILSSLLHICFFPLPPPKFFFKRFGIFRMLFFFTARHFGAKPKCLSSMCFQSQPPASAIEPVDLTPCLDQRHRVSLSLSRRLGPSGSFMSSFARTLLGNTFTNSVPEPLFSLKYNVYHQVHLIHCFIFYARHR